MVKPPHSFPCEENFSRVSAHFERLRQKKQAVAGQVPDPTSWICPLYPMWYEEAAGGSSAPAVLPDGELIRFCFRLSIDESNKGGVAWRGGGRTEDYRGTAFSLCWIPEESQRRVK